VNDPDMKRAGTMIVVAVVTVAAASAIWLWALRPLGGASYLHSSTETEADIIRRYWPQRLIEPEWVSARPDLMSWTITETFVRLSVIGLVWCVIVARAVYVVGRRRRLCAKDPSASVAGGAEL
jgi:hypothetical protein